MAIFYGIRWGMNGFKVLHGLIYIFIPHFIAVIINKFMLICYILHGNFYNNVFYDLLILHYIIYSNNALKFNEYAISNLIGAI